MINKKIDIWDNFTYNSENEGDFRPTLTTYVLEGDKKRGVILILPGGGYGFTSPREAEPIALKYNSAGFHAFVLNYSVSPSRYPQALFDAARAMCIIRENVDKWNIDKEKITVCGFSAGGHLAASLSVFWNEEWLFEKEGIFDGGTKPNASILSYPVITSGEYAHRGSFDNLLGEKPSEELVELLSLEKQVNKNTPPTFIWHTYEDNTVPVENTMLFATALRKQDIPFELHIYPKGGHGLSLATKETANEDIQINPHVSTWINLSIEWLLYL